MKKEIKKRRKQFLAFCLAALFVLCNMTPLLAEAAEYLSDWNSGYFSPMLSTDDKVYVGDLFYVDATMENMHTIYYYDKKYASKDEATAEPLYTQEIGQTGDSTDINGKTYYSGAVMSYEEVTGSSSEFFLCWKPYDVYKSAGVPSWVCLYPVMSQRSAINYVLYGGDNNSANPEDYLEGAGVSSFEPASKLNHTFEGWYSDASFNTPVTAISAEQTGEVTLYAKFEPKTYTINYNLQADETNGGNPTKYTFGTGVPSLADATKPHYDFAGWDMTVNDDGNMVSVTSISATQAGNIILTPKFAPSVYTIKYKLNGGTNADSNPATYTYGTGVESFAPAVKTGYTFAGWYSDAALTARVTAISTTQEGNIVLYAGYTADTVPKEDDTTHSDHTGGTADCTHKAVCESCGEEYGEINANNHAALKHVEATAATTEAEGNTEYWYCENCHRYFGDKDGKNEIKLADTVIAKLTKTDADNKLPKTGDNSHMAFWVVLLFVSGGALIGVGIYGKKKKYQIR